MNHHNFLASLIVSIALLLGLCRPTPAQIITLFSADAKTVTTDTGDVSTAPIATRLYLDSGLTVAAPLDTAIWFVADVNKDGVPAESLGSSQVPLGSLLGTDDHLLFQDVVDGTQAGSIEGRYKGTITVSGTAGEETALKNANIYVYLWNGSGAGFTPVDGSTFGILNLGSHPPRRSGTRFGRSIRT